MTFRQRGGLPSSLRALPSGCGDGTQQALDSVTGISAPAIFSDFVPVGEPQTNKRAKRVGGRNQASFGLYDGDHHPNNFSDFVPLGEPRMNNRAEPRAEARAVLHVLVRKRVGARVAIALDLEYAYDGVTKQIVQWERDAWHTRARPIAHADLWTQLFACMRLHQISVRFFWLPSHVGIDGNEGALLAPLTRRN